jgi:ribonuclease P protein component
VTGGAAARIAAATPTPAGGERLRSSRDVRAVFAARCTAASDVAVVHARRREDTAPARFTVVAGKAVGNAVERNRVKRRLRGVVQILPLQAGRDYVIVGRRGALRATSPGLRAALTRQIQAVAPQ